MKTENPTIVVSFPNALCMMMVPTFPAKMTQMYKDEPYIEYLGM